MTEIEFHQLHQSLIDIAIEAWRFQRVFERVMSKLEPADSARYVSQYSWFSRRVKIALEASHLRLVSIEGQHYDVGMAVTPLNIDDFEEIDQLYIEQMVEPIIMDAETVIKPGVVILGRIHE